ncbi:hypothetical protein BURPSS13_C0041 [Burkholderia pseudomallei S13]|nr:hypothetical protein BURPSS13_C0041 [Burkholderia pseudomallei S13]
MPSTTGATSRITGMSGSSTRLLGKNARLKPPRCLRPEKPSNAVRSPNHANGLCSQSCTP